MESSLNDDYVRHVHVIDWSHNQEVLTKAQVGFSCFLILFCFSNHNSLAFVETIA
jgi:hypothetical protein